MNTALSPEQAAVLQPTVRHVEAGPGSGKTRAVVARFQQQAEVRPGVALLSFTNTAVDVARERSKSSPHLLRTPNFVGTFDTFFNRYVVTPSVRRATGLTPHYLASWDDLPTELSRVRPTNGGLGIRLSRWTRAGDGTIVLDERRLGYEERRAWNQVSPWTQRDITERGRSRIKGLLAKHVYSAEESRRVALELLDAPESILRNRLVMRFNEVIVDEFQDCDIVEHSILRQLQQAGTHVVTVADPDQAIYEFRQVGPSNLYDRHLAGMKDHEVVTLTTCYRSRPVICAAVTSLRSAPKAIESGDPGDTSFPAIHIIVGRGHGAETAGREILNDAGIDPVECRVIAHRRADAQSLRSGQTQLVPTTTVLGSILVAAAQFLNATDAKHRLQAIGRIEQQMLDQLVWGPEGQPTNKSERVEALGITADRVRILAKMVVEAARGAVDAKAFCAMVRNLIRRFAEATSRDVVSNLNKVLAKPTAKIWEPWAAFRSEVQADVTGGLRASHVHAVKGYEFEAVIYVLPVRAKAREPYVLDDWMSDENSEARRVLYVGISRARKLLMFVVPKTKLKLLKQLLERDNIPYLLTDVT